MLAPVDNSQTGREEQREAQSNPMVPVVGKLKGIRTDMGKRGRNDDGRGKEWPPGLQGALSWEEHAAEQSGGHSKVLGPEQDPTDDNQ